MSNLPVLYQARVLQDGDQWSHWYEINPHAYAHFLKNLGGFTEVRALSVHDESRIDYQALANSRAKQIASMKAELDQLRALLRDIAMWLDEPRSARKGVEIERDIRAALSASAEPSAPKCGNCGAGTGQACNDKGCGHLEAGNGALDERAEFEQASEPDGTNLDRNSVGDYVNPYVQSAWEGWSMRATMDHRHDTH